ncbi:hypothetical protein LB506_009253, partial [Fusarium annulatum]
CIQALCEPQEQKREPLSIAVCSVFSASGTVIDRSHDFFESCRYTVPLESRIKVQTDNETRRSRKRSENSAGPRYVQHASRHDRGSRFCMPDIKKCLPDNSTPTL